MVWVSMPLQVNQARNAGLVTSVQTIVDYVLQLTPIAFLIGEEERVGIRRCVPMVSHAPPSLGTGPRRYAGGTTPFTRYSPSRLVLKRARRRRLRRPAFPRLRP